jgi:hypothetical protein
MQKTTTNETDGEWWGDYEKAHPPMLNASARAEFVLLAVEWQEQKTYCDNNWDGWKAKAREVNYKEYENLSTKLAEYFARYRGSDVELTNLLRARRTSCN